MSPKRKKISVCGIGNVVGDNSQSKVQIHVEVGGKPSPAESQKERFWARVFAFLVALGGTLGFFALFVRLLQASDALILLQLILIAIVAALGVVGLLKPEAILKLLEKFIGRVS